MKKEVKFTFFSVIGLIISLLLFYLSAFSDGFHDFSLTILGIHPLIITVIFSVTSFFVAVLAIFKTKEGKSIIVHLIIINITIIISILALLLFTFFVFINNA